MENNDFVDDSFNSNSESRKQLKYGEYLKLEQLLSAQKLKSVEYNQPSHHEHLFIITHQAYELWFKQIIFELDSLRDMFQIGKVEYEDPQEIIKRLNRIVLIFKLLIEQLTILETMTPLDFSEFRDFLCPASGFQSLQFRLIENKLGLSQDDRVEFQKKFLNQCNFNEKADHLLKRSLSEPTMFHLVEEWLETYPWQVMNETNFEKAYKSAIQKFLLEARRSSNKVDLTNKEQLFDSLFNIELHAKMMAQKERKFSQKALLGAIIICIYRNETQFRAFYEIINLLIDVDLHLSKWRFNHMLMVQKMIGSQNIGTGGSTGYNYLRSTISDQYKIFSDLANLPVYLIPRSYISSQENSKKLRLTNEAYN